jgi:DNA-binding NarL/FixJ family response regulator
MGKLIHEGFVKPCLSDRTSPWRAGANSYILKPSNSEILIDTIRGLHGGGGPMSGDIARKIVRQFQKALHFEREDYHLTDEEKEILELLAKGLTYQQAADKVFYQPQNY